MGACSLWELVDADTWTLDFMEKDPHLFPWADAPAIWTRLQQQLRAQLEEEQARQLLMDADPAGSGVVPFRHFHVRPCSPSARLSVAAWRPQMQCLHFFYVRQPVLSAL